jgi:hypothetical protein
MKHISLFSSPISAVSKTICALALVSLATNVSLFAFDWPQNETASDSFYSYFGQLRGGTIETSLIFKDSSDVKAADNGTIVATLTEHGDDFGWFESTLGNTVIIAHDNQLMTIYANLDEDTVPPTLTKVSEVKTGTFLGTSGNSGWQEGRSCLEFQVVDTKNNASINPRILMPRIGEELPLVIGDLSLTDRNGETSYLTVQHEFASGQYSLYRTRQSVAVPYRTTVSINGALVETISYDMLKEDNGTLCAYGNKYYPKELLYPDNKRQLLAQVQLTKGRNTVAVSISDILGYKETLSYKLDVY